MSSKLCTVVAKHKIRLKEVCALLHFSCGTCKLTVHNNVLNKDEDGEDGDESDVDAGHRSHSACLG